MSTVRPVVGITAYDATASWGIWHAPAMLLPRNYLDALVCAGAAPLVIPVGTDPTAVLDRLDGFVLIGGPDVDPARYGAARMPETQPADTARDELELALALGAGARGLPLLAICRGVQVLNVARGGTLTQHLPELVGHARHSPGPGVYGSTSVGVVADTLLAGWASAPNLTVDCYHHQSLDRLGTGLVVSARADDGVIEAVEDPSAAFLLGVQWHPEVGTDRSLFRAFVTACTPG